MSFKQYYKYMVEDKTPITSKLKPGDKIKNTYRDCMQYKRKG